MAVYTELTQSTTMRKRIPLREAFIEAFPEETPILSMIKKSTGKRTTSPTSSEVEWPFKKFRAGRHKPIYDGEDVTSDEAETNDANKDMIKTRIQLTRVAVFTGRIAEAVVIQHGGVTSKYKDDLKDALRGMRADKELILKSDADSKAMAASPKVGYQTRGFASWCRTGAHTDLPIPSMARIPSGNIKSVASASAFTESNLRAMLQSCWDTRKTKGNWFMFNTPALQTQIDEWLVTGPANGSDPAIRRYNNDASTGTIKLGVKLFEGTFGTVKMTPTHDMPTEFTDSVTTTNTSATVTVADNSLYYAGMEITGTGIPADTRVLSVPLSSTTSIILSAAATASGTVTATVSNTVFAELWDFDFAELGFVDEVGWQDLENKGGGPRGYADSLWFLANLNPQAHGLVNKS